METADENENRQMAKNGIILGVVLTIVAIMLVVVTQLAFISTMPSVWICLYRLEKLICKELFFGIISFFDTEIIG